MNRTFQHKLNIQSVAAVVIIAACALWCFLARTSLSPVFGFACMLLGAAAVDRMLHTEYVITTDNRLVISRGRIVKPKAINIDEIVAVRPVRGMLFVAPYVLIEYGMGRATSVQPADTAAFIKEMKRRLK